MSADLALFVSRYGWDALLSCIWSTNRWLSLGCLCLQELYPERSLAFCGGAEKNMTKRRTCSEAPTRSSRNQLLKTSVVFWNIVVLYFRQVRNGGCLFTAFKFNAKEVYILFQFLFKRGLAIFCRVCYGFFHTVKYNSIGCNNFQQHLIHLAVYDNSAIPSSCSALLFSWAVPYSICKAGILPANLTCLSMCKFSERFCLIILRIPNHHFKILSTSLSQEAVTRIMVNWAASPSNRDT